MPFTGEQRYWWYGVWLCCAVNGWLIAGLGGAALGLFLGPIGNLLGLLLLGGHVR